MKKGPLIFAGIVILIFAGLCLVVAVTVSGKPKYFASPTEERDWARAEYDALFVEPTKPLPVFSSVTPITRTMTLAKGKNRVDFTFPTTADEDSKINRFGTRIDAKPGNTAVMLPDGNTLRFLGVATHFPEQLNERHKQGFVDLRWHDPATLKPLGSAEVSERNLETTTRLDLSDRTLVFAFDVADSNIPHRWQSLDLRNADTLCRVYSGSQAQTREHVRYFHVDLKVYHQCEIMALISLSHGKPEIQTIDFTTHALDEPILFDSGNVQLKIPFRRDGNQNSSSYGGGGVGESEIGFGWADASTSYQKSFVIIDCWPPVQWRQFEWRPTEPVKNRDYWRGTYGDQGLSAIDFTKPLAETRPMKVRHFPDLTHVSFRLTSVPGLSELKNLFDAESGPVRFQNAYDARRFVESATQTQFTWHGDVWPASSSPIELDNITPGEIIMKAESLNGIQLDMNSETHKIELWAPKPFFKRLGDWFKNLF